jgi:hypothetical protein
MISGVVVCGEVWEDEEGEKSLIKFWWKIQ